jgi:uncharacterized protein (DUF486 family)
MNNIARFLVLKAYEIGLHYCSAGTGEFTFMTLAWYGHLKFREYKWFEALPLVGIILFSWGIALFEYFSRYLPTELDSRVQVDLFHW